MKRLIIKTETTANYIGHLLAIGEVGFQNKYAKKYKETVKSEDISFLQKHKKLLKWADGFSGDLTWLFIFFISYINPESKEDFFTLTQLIRTSIQKKNYNEIKQKYEFELKKLDFWTGQSFPSFKYASVMLTLVDIFERNYDSFIENVLLNEQAMLEQKVMKVQKTIDHYDFIDLWEHQTNLDFRFPVYEIVLGLGLENAPNANSLGYDKNWFDVNTDIDSLIPFICHEIGTHILIEIMLSTIKAMQTNSGANAKEFKYYYQGYESLCSFYNKAIIGKAGLSSSIQFQGHNEQVFHKIFEKIQQNNPSFSAIELYHFGVETFKKILNSK